MSPPKKSGPPRRAGPGGPKRPGGPDRPAGKRPAAPTSRATSLKDDDARPRADRGKGDRTERPRADRPRPDRARVDAPRAEAPSRRRAAPQDSPANLSEGDRTDRPRAERSRPERQRTETRKPYSPRKPGAKKPAPARPANPHPAHAAAASDGKGEPQRIAKLLARAGIASRREIERMIEEGRIAKDGVLLDTPATLLTSLHGVTVDGVAVAAPPPARLFLFHKPVGCLTTERDPAGRPTIYDRLPAGLPRLMPIGRLDMNTEGLLLLTTDGGFKRQMELPSTGVPRTYRARAFGEVSQQQLEDLFDGLEIDGIRYGQIEANLERRTGRNQWIEMSLTEGKNREVRRVLEHLDLKVNRLIRTSYGPFHLGELPVGAVEEVRQHDLIQFRNSLKADTK
ncbi:pseudouridine synthase [Sphingobium sp. V4]|uniref:pseudouridine synthase n=1 Tax=Sphingobium sp. V4 TaxID=3038927 RepID=UPI0025580CE0|nr:pseudouridine synthase [Sphingobium sp. V4]WIW89759.1 pseudouridine synthase [Sphingobium sp. V4]